MESLWLFYISRKTIGWIWKQIPSTPRGRIQMTMWPSVSHWMEGLCFALFPSTSCSFWAKHEVKWKKKKLYRDLPDQDDALEERSVFQADRTQGYSRIRKCGLPGYNIDALCSHTYSNWMERVSQMSNFKYENANHVIITISQRWLHSLLPCTYCQAVRLHSNLLWNPRETNMPYVMYISVIQG